MTKRIKNENRVRSAASLLKDYLLTAPEGMKFTYNDFALAANVDRSNANSTFSKAVKEGMVISTGVKVVHATVYQSAAKTVVLAWKVRRFQRADVKPGLVCSPVSVVPAPAPAPVDAPVIPMDAPAISMAGAAAPAPVDAPAPPSHYVVIMAYPAQPRTFFRTREEAEEYARIGYKGDPLLVCKITGLVQEETVPVQRKLVVTKFGA